MENRGADKEGDKQHAHDVEGDFLGERRAVFRGERCCPVEKDERHADWVDDADQPGKAKEDVRDQTFDHMRSVSGSGAGGLID